MTDSPLRPVKTEQRVSFGISWYATEAEADEAARRVRAAGLTYNGGFFHGSPLGRDRTFDSTDVDGTKLYAVTD